MKKEKLFLLLIYFAVIFSQGNAQLVVNNSAPYNTINYLVQNVLLGSGVQVSNITYTGAPIAVGYFNGLSSNLNLDSGIVLTSGDINIAVGPNDSVSAGVNNLMPGDLQLEQMTNNTANGSFDAAIIEFDFVANADTVKFEYVFGSEEYMEWVNSTFNDAFAFIISGVSVVLPATNIALIPSPPSPPNTPVTIDNVNLDSFPQYYFDNETPPGQTVQYDGFTTVLTAIFPVQSGQTYHIKMVVADIGDGIYDSGVFLKAGSFSSYSVISPASVNNLHPENPTLVIFPNPTFDIVSVNLKNASVQKMKVKITNSLGEEVYQQNFFGREAKIYTANFSSGIYFIRVENGNDILHEKFIKQ